MPGHSTRKRRVHRRKRATGADGRVETFKLLGDPLRQRLLTALNERVASPKELAEEFGENLGRLSYHVKVLADAGAIELVRTAKRRGATEHFYRGAMRPILDEADWSKIPPAARDAIGIQTFKEIQEHVVEAAEAGGFEDPQVHVSWVKLELDPEAHAKLVDELEAVVRRAIDLQGDTANRGAAGGSGESIRSELAILHFRRPLHEGSDESA